MNLNVTQDVLEHGILKKEDATNKQVVLIMKNQYVLEEILIEMNVGLEFLVILPKIRSLKEDVTQIVLEKLNLFVDLITELI